MMRIQVLNRPEPWTDMEMGADGTASLAEHVGAEAVRVVLPERRIYAMESEAFIRPGNLGRLFDDDGTRAMMEKFGENAAPGEMIELSGPRRRYVVVVTDGRMMKF